VNPMATRLLTRAARNNAEWCSTLSSAHAGPGSFERAFWIKRGKVPPYMSKMVTLEGAESRAAQFAAIRSLLQGGAELPFSVKDAFDCLELGSLGFTKLFEATWIVAPADSLLRSDSAERVHWELVTHADELAAWERAWRGSSANEALRDESRVFPDRLLQVAGLHFVLGSLDGTPIASAALNRSGDVIGLSNVFSARKDAGPLFPGCLRIARRVYPGLPVVGYARGADLSAAKQAGFEELHGLTVWQSPEP
jgi:hypothetical protein